MIFLLYGPLEATLFLHLIFEGIRCDSANIDNFVYRNQCNNGNRLRNAPRGIQWGQGSQQSAETVTTGYRNGAEMVPTGHQHDEGGGITRRMIKILRFERNNI